MQNIPTPVVHQYKEINPGKYTTVKHYELQEVENGNLLLADQINISKDRKFARSRPDYWLKIKEGKKWSGNITGLFKTSIPGLFRGDQNDRQNLMLFRFNRNAEEVIIYYFKDFFTADLRHVLPLTQQVL